MRVHGAGTLFRATDGLTACCATAPADGTTSGSTPAGADPAAPALSLVS